MEELTYKFGKFTKQRSITVSNGSISVTRRRLQFPISRKLKWKGWWKYKALVFDASLLGHLFIEPAKANKLFALFDKDKYYIHFGQLMEDNDDSNGDYTCYELVAPKEFADNFKGFVEACNPLYKREDSFVYEQAIRVPFRRKEILWANNQYIVYTRRAKTDLALEAICVPIKTTLFYNIHKGKVYDNIIIRWIMDKLKLTGSIYFGCYEQIDMAYPGADMEQKLYKYLTDNGAPIEMEDADELYEGHFCLSSIFHPKRWFVKEKIGFTKHAVIYQKTTLRGVDTQFLPFDFCYAVLHTWGISRERLEVYGLMNVITVQSFDKPVVAKFVKKAKEHGLDANDANGLVMRSSYLWFYWLYVLVTLGIHRNAKVIEGEKIFVFNKGGRGFANKTEGKHKISIGSIGGRTQILPKQCTTVFYQREKWYSLFGELYFDCDMESVRKDQKDSAHVSIVLSKVGYFRAKRWTDHLGGTRHILSGLGAC